MWVCGLMMDGVERGYIKKCFGVFGNWYDT